MNLKSKCLYSKQSNRFSYSFTEENLLTFDGKVYMVIHDPCLNHYPLLVINFINTSMVRFRDFLM
jgi:hypothetical protein